MYIYKRVHVTWGSPCCSRTLFPTTALCPTRVRRSRAANCPSRSSSCPPPGPVVRTRCPATRPVPAGAARRRPLSPPRPSATHDGRRHIKNAAHYRNHASRADATAPHRCRRRRLRNLGHSRLARAKR